ncbi:MAG: zinc-ribbon domain-containing protein [Deltaproteobacteria bacterium]|jgi:hypothetical protein|nr:zinc-ribbon domain-containing protein [Deltaproteobacteria bacterium]
MSKIICPNCKSSFKVSDPSLLAKFEDPKIWARCPNCSERFHPQLLDISSQLGLNDGVNFHNSDIHSKIDNIVTNIKEKDTDIPIKASDLLYRPSTSRLASKLGIMSFAIIIIAFLALIPLSYVGASLDPPAVQSQVRREPNIYSDKELTRDLLSLRQDIRTKRTLEREISYSGRESKIYKHLVNNLSPAHCQEIVSMRVWSKRTIEGVKFKGVCLKKDADAAELSIKWYNDRIEASVSQDKDPVVLLLASND